MWSMLGRETGDPSSLLSRAIALAARQALSIYLVGGSVRDLYLKTTPKDLDLVLSGDAIAFARRLVRGGTEKLQTHHRFGTTVLMDRQGRRLDLAMARSESYPAPAALPRVRPDSLKKDLRRRDFTINAIALELLPTGFGQAVDPTAGRADLRRGMLRVLHPSSFLDDPTRAYRAVRLAARLGFRIERATSLLLRTAVQEGVVRRLKPARLGAEIVRLASEEHVPKTLRLLRRYHLLAAIHSALEPDTAIIRQASRLWQLVVRHGRPLNRPVLLMVLLGLGRNDVEFDEALGRLQFARGDKQRIINLRQQTRTLLSPGLELEARARATSEAKILAAAVAGPVTG